MATTAQVSFGIIVHSGTDWGEAIIDQASILVVSEGPALARIDQASMLVVWGDLGGNTQIDQASMLVVSEGPALTRIDQASMLAVWAESVPGPPGGGGRQRRRKGQARGRGFSTTEINASLSAGFNSAFD